MRKGRSAHSEAVEDLHINLTPLIDVVFVVLIMFIVIAPMLETDRVQLAEAGKKEEMSKVSSAKESGIAIHVHADNTVWVKGQKVSGEQLTSFLRKMRKEQPKEIPQVFQDKKSHFGTYQIVKNAVEESGFEQMDVILQPR